MKTSNDFGALNWIKDELDETIQKARLALEAYVESEIGIDSLVVCANHLHQAAGVLRMAQVYGPGMLAEEMEAVVRSMAAGHVRHKDDAAEALMLALIQLPDYLEQLQGGDVDVPLIILPLLNDLRAVREAPLLSEIALFKPKIEQIPAYRKSTSEPNPELPSIVRRLRQKYHVALLNWFRKQDTATAWQYLIEVFDELEQHAGTHQVHRLAWVSSALIRGLMDHSISTGVAVKQLFGKIDRQLKCIIDSGEIAVADDQSADLLTNLLYYIAQADSDNERIRQVKDTFELDSILPSEAQLAQGRQGLSGSNAELAASISGAIQIELTRVKDVLDLFMRKERTDTEMLIHLEKPMRQLADTLGMIGQGALRSRLLRQADKVQTFINRSGPPEEYELMEMAGDILFVESSLGTLQKIQASKEDVEKNDERWGLNLPEGEYRNLIKQTVREAKVDIAKAKEAIIGYTEVPDDFTVLHAVYEGFVRVCGALKLLEFMDAAKVLEQTSDFIRTDMIDDRVVPTRQQLNLLADIISSIEYFLEALVDGAGNRFEIIAIAQSALDALHGSRTESVGIPSKADVLAFNHSQDVRNEELLTQPTIDDFTEIKLTDESNGLLAETVPLDDVVTADAEPVPSREKPALENIDSEILEIFIEEAREELESIHQHLPAWQKDHEDKDALISFRRSFHTLKGSGRLVGAKAIGELAWSVENMLNRVIDETIKPTSVMMALLSDVLEMLPILIDCQEQTIVPSVDLEGTIQRAFMLADGRAIIAKAVNAEVREENDDDDVLHHSLMTSSEAAENLYENADQQLLRLDDEVALKAGDNEDPGSLIDETDREGESVLQIDNIESNQRGFSDSDITIEVDSELLNVFAEESENHLAVLEDFISQTKSSSPRLHITDEIIRAYHTMHGSARMTGITPIANVSKSVENYLKTLNEKNYLVDDSVTAQIEESVSYIRKLLAWIQDDGLQEPNADSFLAKLVAAQDELSGLAIATQDQGEKGALASSAVGQAEERQKEAGLEYSRVPENIEQSFTVPHTNESYVLNEDPELVEIFMEEAKELLQSIQENYLTWQNERINNLPLEAIQRGLHTLKGSARLAGITPIGDLSHALEKVFIGLSEFDVQPSDPLLDAIQDSLETLSIQLDEVDRLHYVQWAPDQISRLEMLFEAVISDPAKDFIQEVENTQILLNDTSLTTSQVEDLDVGLELVESEDSTQEFAAEKAVVAHGEPSDIVCDDDLFEATEDPELLEVFIEEAKDLLESLEISYHLWIKNASDAQQLPQIQRSLHTLKGSARLAGVLPVGDLSHALESLFNNLVEGRVELSTSLLSTIRQAIDKLANQVDEVETIGRMHRADALIKQLETIRHRIPAQSEIPSQESAAVAKDAMAAESGDDADSYQSNAAVGFQGSDDLFVVEEDPELVEIFIEEAREILEHLEEGFQRWVSNQDDHAKVDDMQRSLHTLKGSARLAGISPVGDLSHSLESLLTKLANQAIQPSESVLQTSRQALDKLAIQIEEISASGKVTTAEAILAQLAKIIHPEASIQEVPSAQQVDETQITQSGTKSPEELPESAVVLPFISEIAKKVESRKQQTATHFKPSKDQVRINAELMDRLVNHAGEVSIYRARLEQQNNVLGFNLAELEQTVSRLFTQLRNLEIETEAQILYRWDRDNEQDDWEKAEFDPLELDRFSTMQQLSRALVETVSDLGSIYEVLADLQRETDTLLLQQSRISTDLQDGLLRTRMVPFSQLVPRLQRLVRQTADQLGKKAQLEVFGSKGELDRNILNRMVPVLEHLLRNAVSHGIEFPDNRRMSGKQDLGQISLSIDREATDVLITLADDGKGLDIEAIRSQAIRQGIIDESAEVSDDDLIQCVLHPGFSTAKEVTQISGRGVGLDVVASEVKQLSGNLDIESRPGQGSRFTIRLPLTLAITDALLVRVGEEIYAIPHGGVEGVVRVKRKELQACYMDDQQSYKYADRNYKAVYLGRMMGMENIDLSENVKWFPLLLVHTGEHHAALQVDELLGTRQIVVKSVGKQVGSVRWITGGTILADGRVALILDVGALVRMDAARVASAAPTSSPRAQKDTEERIRVMVVDDSITVRKVTGRLLERHGMEVVTAKDGVEAVALLQEQLPDIMLLDIEMPRMDGFEVARHINNSVEYYGLPIIMISSRVGEKHRQRAFQLGVKRCLGKPYQEAELLKNINEVLAGVKT